jgi:hypothetical protein
VMLADVSLLTSGGFAGLTWRSRKGEASGLATSTSVPS